ncbi:MAG: hypothetical protein RLZZ420_1882 [Bacteroidota bacterium]
MLKKIFLQGLVILCINQPLISNAQVVHVAVSGNDNNPGTQIKPLATPQAARNLLRKLRKDNKVPVKTATVFLHKGTYDLDQTFVLDSMDGGSAEYPVNWTAFEKNEVILSGGKTVSPKLFRKISNPAVAKRFTKDAALQVMELDIKKAGITNTGKHRQYGHALPVIPSTMELYFNHEPMTLARYPNKGAILIGKVKDPGSVPRTGDKSNRGALFNYTDDRHKHWAGQSNIWIQGTLNYGFADDYNSIEKIDTTNKTVKLGKPHIYGVGAGKDFQSYVAINILEELDEPGEWYLDEQAGKLYLWPPAQLKDADIKVSILEEPIVALEGVNHLRFSGMKIEAGRGIGIYMENCTYTEVAGCTIRNVGTTGIVMGQGAQLLDENSSVDDYVGIPVSRQVGSYQNHIYRNTTWNRNAGHHNRILSCDIYNTGSGGIMLSGGDKKSLTQGNNTVENCRISLYNRRNKFTFAGIRVDGCGNTIKHNEIFNSDWHGIFVHGNEHIFEYNHIHDVTLNSNDTSPWYIGRNPSDRGNIVRYNFFDHCGNKNRMNMGIYCDDSSADVFIYGNVFNDMLTDHGVLFSNTGWHLVMKNNIIINPLAHTAVTSANYYTWAAPQAKEMFGENGTIRNRLTKDIDFQSPPYSTKYPSLLPYLDVITPGKEWQSMRARGNMLEGNLIVGGPENPIKLLGGEHAQMEGKNNWVTKEDPGFVDMINKNFNLKKEAKVYQMIPGFEAVPFNKMGIYKDQYRQ